MLEADRVVARIVEEDRNVFETLLTTGQFFVYHNMDNEKGAKLIAGPATGKAPMRFIFMHKGNGLFPDVVVPPSLSTQDAAKEKAKQPFSVDLNKHELPEWMKPVAAHKNQHDRPPGTLRHDVHNREPHVAVLARRL